MHVLWSSRPHPPNPLDRVSQCLLQAVKVRVERGGRWDDFDEAGLDILSQAGGGRERLGAVNVTHPVHISYGPPTASPPSSSS